MLSSNWRAGWVFCANRCLSRIATLRNGIRSAVEQGLHLRRQIAVLQDELEQHADQINRVFVCSGDMGFFIAVELAGLIEQFLLDLLHDLRSIGR